MPVLTTTKAPFVEEAPERGQLYIHQPYDSYSAENHATWAKLYARMLPRWRRYANPRFLGGIESLCLDAGRIPRLEDVNRYLAPKTGFRAIGVSGYVPAYLFFDCLRRREFPTTVTIRDGEHLDYLPEPDIFHDVAGHVPMHTDPAFAEALVRFGKCAATAAEMATDSERISNIVKALARFFWFTVEFGLMRQGGEIKAYGSGLLSSFSELEHAIESPRVQRYPLQLEWVINQPFEINHYQPLLFIVESFEQIYDLAGELDRWMRAGKLDSVAPGEPELKACDLESFRLR